MPTILLLDNGSSRAESTLNLRRLAAALGERLGETVHPVSLLHANRVPAEALGGRKADTFQPFLRREVQAGGREFLVLPLFFGQSGALTGFIPETVETLQAEHGPFDVRIAEVLCPLPEGEPGLVRILLDNLTAAAEGREPPRQVVLVDHGSPLPAVTEVRRWLAGRMREALSPGVRLEEAVMERRSSSEYDFNGPLLAEVLDRLGAEGSGPVHLAMLFLSAGRHAGADGDVEEICGAAQAAHPGLEVRISPLVASHPAIVDILEARARASL
jgi:sirohydrochlorin ferrochelatase